MKQLLTIFLLVLPLLTQARQNLNTSIDSMGKATLFYTSTAGAYISVTKGENTFYSSSFGFNDAKEETLITDTSSFPISSNTKAFNSILLAQMVYKNRLSWDAPIKSYLNELKLESGYVTNNLNISDLLTHRYGYPRYDFTYFILSEKEEENSNRAVFNKLRYLEQRHGFRTEFQYGHNQYIVAAYLLEQLTNKKWEDLLEEQLLQPLGMEQTHCDLDKYLASEGKILGYQGEEPVDIELARALYKVSGAGNMFSTIRDLEKWCDFLLKGDKNILTKAAIDETLAPKFTVGHEEPYEGFSAMQYAYGWFVFDYFGHKVVMHRGKSVGHESMVVLLPDDHISWRIISNEGFDSPSFPQVMTFSLLDLMTGRKLRDWNKALPQPGPPELNHPDSLREKNTEATVPYMDLIGTYEHKGFGKIRIFIDGGKMQFTAGDYSGLLKYWENDSYRTYSEVFKEDALFTFFKEGDQVYMKTDLIEPSIDPIKFKKVGKG